MSNKKMVNIEFTWRNKTISQFIPLNSLYRDIMSEDDFWGSFECYQYQIHWNSGQIAIFINERTEIIGYADSFNITFSKNY